MRLFRYVPFTITAIVGSIVIDLIVVRLLGMSERIGLLVVLNLAALVLGLVLDAARLRQRPFEFQGFAPFAPDEILDRADTWLEDAGWDLQESPDDRVVATRQPAMNTATLIVLFLAGIVPGVIYLVMSRRAKTVTMTVMATPAQGGGTVDLSGTGLSSEALAFFRALHAQASRRPVLDDERGVDEASVPAGPSVTPATGGTVRDD